MFVSLSLTLFMAVVAAEPASTTKVAAFPGEAAVGFAAGPLRQHVRVLAVLSGWERAAEKLPPLTDAERVRALRISGGGISAHEAAVALRFRGRVSMQDLLRDYRWTELKQFPGEVHLIAAPTDAVERLFYSRFRIRLDAKTSLPNAIRFHHADDRPNIVLAIPIEIPSSPRTVGEGGIKLVNAEGQTPVAAPRPLPKLNKGTDNRVKVVLRRWQEAVSRDDVIEVGAYVYIYDLTFNIEKRSIRTLRFEDPNRFSIQIRPLPISWGARSERRNRNGKPFHLQTEREQSWTGDGKKLVQSDNGKSIEYKIDPKNPTCLKFAFFGPHSSGINVLDGLMPFARFEKADIETRFWWKIEKETESEFWLSAIPKTKSTAACMRCVRIILDRASYRPKAVQRVDPGGNRETVHVFTKWITVPRAVK